MATDASPGRLGADGNLGARLAGVFTLHRVLAVYFVLAAVYIYTPSISLIVFSFNEGGVTFPITELTVGWYAEFLTDDRLIASISRSIQLAIVVTIITTVLGTMTALAYRYDFRGKNVVLYLLLVGIIVPGVTYGIGSALLFNNTLGLRKGLWLAVPVHVVWALPFAVIVLLAGFPPHLARNEDAARVMGADRLSTFREVILPQIAPTVLGAAVFAFTLSYNEGSRGILITGDATTMPNQVFAIASAQRVSPELFAVGAVTTVFSTLLLVVSAVLILYGIRRSN